MMIGVYDVMREVTEKAIGHTPSGCLLVYDRLRRILFWKCEDGERYPITNIDSIPFGKFLTYCHPVLFLAMLDTVDTMRRFLDESGDFNRLQPNAVAMRDSLARLDELLEGNQEQPKNGRPLYNI
jgi:hypothetical protein